MQSPAALLPPFAMRDFGSLSVRHAPSVIEPIPDTDLFCRSLADEIFNSFSWISSDKTKQMSHAAQSLAVPEQSIYAAPAVAAPEQSIYAAPVVAAPIDDFYKVDVSPFSFMHDRYNPDEQTPSPSPSETSSRLPMLSPKVLAEQQGRMMLGTLGMLSVRAADTNRFVVQPGGQDATGALPIFRLAIADQTFESSSISTAEERFNRALVSRSRLQARSTGAADSFRRKHHKLELKNEHAEVLLDLVRNSQARFEERLAVLKQSQSGRKNKGFFARARQAIATYIAGFRTHWIL